MKKLDDESLKLLREALPVDGVRKIKERLIDISISTIQKTLNGERNKEAVILAAIEIAKEEKSKKDALKNEILELVS